MKKRTISAVLWLYAGWYGGALLSELFGISTFVGLLPAIAMAAFVLDVPSRLLTASPSVRRTAGSDSI